MSDLTHSGFDSSGIGHSGNVDTLIDRPWLSNLQLKLFAICAFVLFCEGYDLQALALAVPDISAEFGIEASSFSIALSASLFGLGLGGVAFGPLGDRIGRKPMLIIAMLIAGISTLAALIYPTTSWIAFCRLFTGIGLGITTVNSAAMMSDYAPARWRFIIIAVLSCTVPMGAFTAAMIAPMVIEELSWRGIFWIGGLVPLLAALSVWLFVAESIKWLLTAKPSDSRIAIIAEKLAPGIDPTVLHLSPVGKIERQSVFGLLSPACRIRTLVAWLSAASGAFCLYLMVSWLPTVLQEAQWSTADALRGTAAVQFGGIFGSLLMAWAIDRRKLLPGMLTGYICATLALLAIGLLPSSVIGWQLLLLFVGAGTGGMQSVWMSIAVGLYPLELRATSAGWVAGISRIGAIFAPFAGGAALAAQVEARNMLLALVIPIGISTIAIILARKHFVPPPPAIEHSS
jgi:MFS transporter, AAHS family, 4-hydroxybenzoate transporter